MIEVFEFSSFDIAEMYSAKYGEKYYMNTPRRYMYPACISPFPVTIRALAVFEHLPYISVGSILYLGIF